MSNQIVFSNEEALERFEKAGIKRISDVANILFSKHNWSAKEIRIVLSAISRIGAYNVSSIFTSHNTATRQLIKSSERSKNTIKPALIHCDIAIKFLPIIARIIDDKKLKKDGYSFAIHPSGDGPFYMSVELSSPKKSTSGINRRIGMFNFDLFFKNGKPATILGNFQGNDREEIDRFKRKYRKSPLDYLLVRFEEGFPIHTRRLALHPRRHNYRSPNPFVILNKMKIRGEVTKNEVEGYISPELAKENQIPSERITEISRTIENEMRRIITTGTGMHTAAFVKARYQRSKSRFWRPKPKRPSKRKSRKN